MPGYGKIAKPITHVTKKAVPDRVLWTPQSELAFHLLCKLLCNECILTISLALDYKWMLEALALERY